MSNLPLRHYQRESIDVITSNFKKGINRQLISQPTGSGKTVVFANLIKELGMRSLVFVHTDELLKQACEKIRMICPDLEVGIVNGSKKEFHAHIVVCSIQAATYPSNLSKLIEQNFPLIIADECHHFAAESSRKVLFELGCVKGSYRLLVGFTATPFRSDGRGLGEVFDVIAYQVNITSMIDQGYLCPPKGLKIATNIDLSNVKTKDEDFQTASLAEIMDTAEINKAVVDAYLKNAEGKQTICFGVNVQHAKNLSEAFMECGISSKVIFGEMNKDERSAIVSQYREGTVQVLCNCQILTEGFDAPETSCIIVARPTKSTNLYQQMVGRGLRLWPNKQECIILDFGDCNHTICNTAVLLQDAACVSNQEKEEKERKKKIIASLPSNLNKNLKIAFLNFDPLGRSFTWVRQGLTYSMQGAYNSRLSVSPENSDNYRVVLSTNNGDHLIAEGLSFEYAFAAAEDFAKEHRSLFVINDLEAKWRDLAVTDNQKIILYAHGYKSGIDGLTRGQASILISQISQLKRRGFNKKNRQKGFLAA